MSANKNNNNTFENIMANSAIVGQNLGIVLMAAATTLGLVEISNHENTKATLAAQPVYEVAGTSESPNPIRRERTEETGPHYISYGVGQRTPGRTGKV